MLTDESRRAGSDAWLRSAAEWALHLPFRIGDYIEVNQLLKLVGACDSGGAGKALAAEGRVRVDGQPESRKTAKIRAGQTVTFDNLHIVVAANNGS